MAFNLLVLVISLFSSRFLHLSLVSPGSNCGRTWLVWKGWCLSQGLRLRHVTRVKNSPWLSIILGWCYIVAMRSRRRFSLYATLVSGEFPWDPSLWTVTSGFSWFHVFLCDTCGFLWISTLWATIVRVRFIVGGKVIVLWECGLFLELPPSF